MASGTLTLEDIVSKTTDLPTIPAAALAVIRETDSPNATARGVALHIGQDQALAARVLRLANSAYYGLQRQIMDHHEAVVALLAEARDFLAREERAGRRIRVGQQ